MVDDAAPFLSTPEAQRAVYHLVTHCGGVRPGENVFVVCDTLTRNIANAFVLQGQELGAKVSLAQIPNLDRHGVEPPAAIGEKMLAADLTISLCQNSLAHSHARHASAASGRFLSLPQYSLDLLCDPSIMVDYEAQAATVRRFADVFTKGSEIRIKTRGGTNMALRIDGRVGNYCPGFVRKPGDLGSPPDIEANVSPIETSAEGVAVIDGSIACPELGLLRAPVTLTLENGRVVAIDSALGKYVEVLTQMLGPSRSPRRVLAECGVGLNPKARLTGVMLVDEGTLGCVHFGFGANHAVGGRNVVDFHLDFVMRDASLWVDGVSMLRDGVLR
jgi:leucyl aminopeptidase (aminopeptidase T)